MFYYLGRKKAVSRHYPGPRHDLVIEPFAGSAAYSLHGGHWQRRVVLNDLNPMVVRAWGYLKQASEQDILALPVPERGQRLSAIRTLSEVERWLIAQHINPGADQRSDVVTGFSRWPVGKKYIAANLHKVRHFEIREGEYHTSLADLEDEPATWFVDPPYAGIGYYRTNTVDYAALGAWCRERRGQVVVCERQGAEWLPFRPLVRHAICGHAFAHEAVYIREDAPDRMVPGG